MRFLSDVNVETTGRVHGMHVKYVMSCHAMSYQMLRFKYVTIRMLFACMYVCMHVCMQVCMHAGLCK